MGAQLRGSPPPPVLTTGKPTLVAMDQSGLSTAPIVTSLGLLRDLVHGSGKIEKVIGGHFSLFTSCKGFEIPLSVNTHDLLSAAFFLSLHYLVR
jgi:hypothetical protein